MAAPVRKKSRRLFVCMCELYAADATKPMSGLNTPMRRLFALLLLPVIAVLLSSPVLASGPAKPAPVSVRPAVGDAQLDATIRAKLAKSKIGKDGFRFHVARGVVTWEGNTSVGQHKGAATRMARTSGAVAVVNNIKVSANGSKNGAGLRKAYVQQ